MAAAKKMYSWAELIAFMGSQFQGNIESLLLPPFFAGTLFVVQLRLVRGTFAISSLSDCCCRLLYIGGRNNGSQNGGENFSDVVQKCLFNSCII